MLPIWEADFRLETLIFFHHLTVTSIHHIQVANYQIFTKVTSQGPTDIEKSTSQMMFRQILQQQKEHPKKDGEKSQKMKGIPEKTDIDAKNGHILKESTFSEASFWVIQNVFGDVYLR